MMLNGVHQKSLTIEVADGCAADTIPGQTAVLGGHDDPGYLALPALNRSTNTFLGDRLDQARRHPAGIQPIFMLDGDVAAGFNFLPGSNHLGYHWPGGQWWWDSGLTEIRRSVVVRGAHRVADEHFGIRHGRKATHNVAAEPVNFNESSRLGSYKGWGGRQRKRLARRSNHLG